MKYLPILVALAVGGAAVYLYKQRQVKEAPLDDIFGGAVDLLAGIGNLWNPTPNDKNGNPRGTASARTGPGFASIEDAQPTTVYVNRRSFAPA